MKKDPEPLSFRFGIAAATISILLATSLFGAFDIALHMRGLDVYRSLEAFLWWTLIGVLLSLPTGLLVTLMIRWVHPNISDSTFAGLLAALLLQILAFLIFNGVLTLALFLFAWLIAFGASKVSVTRKIKSVIFFCLIFLSGLLIIVGGLAYARSSKPELVSGQNSKSSLPNIVLIVLDTTRADYLGVYGSRKGLTPNLDRLARDGTVYENAISAADWTVPSHASIFTGLYPVSHGASFENHRWLDDDFVTLPEMLKKVGYRSAAISANVYLHQSNLLQGFDQYVFLRQNELSTLHRIALAAGFPLRWADKGSAFGIEEIKGWISNETHRPLFLFVNFMEPHWRYFPPIKQRMQNLAPDLSCLQATRLSAVFFGVNMLAGQKAPASMQKAVQSMYSGEVAYQDEQLGRMLEVIRSSFDFDQTLLIITADHGENLGEAGRWDHIFAVNDYLVRVPLIIRYPKQFPPGKRVEGQASLIDIVPTIFDALERTPPVPALPGHVLAPDRFVAHDFTFADSVPYYGHLERMSLITGLQRDISEFTATLRAVRTNDYKYIWTTRGEEMLYDLQHDPDEAKNVLAEHPEIAEEMREQLFRWWQEQPRYKRSGKHQAEPFTSEEKERLRSLGYVQ